MKNVNVTILNSEEIENITADTITEDTATATHYNNLKNLIDILTAEKKAIDSALIEKHGHEKYKDKNISISVYDSYTIDMDTLADDIGKERLEKHRTKVKHTERVVRFG